MTKEEAVETLRAIAEASHSDPESAHADADDVLLNYIDDADIRAAFESVARWYA